MARSVEIDPGSGFCGGVIRAIGGAERFLDSHPGQCLYSLGSIVHNEAELERLSRKGLRTTSLDALRDNPPPKGETLLIRAHGEPPSTYRLASSLSLDVIDCTCPVVLKLQKDIREAFLRVNENSGQIVIFGKIGHAEVLGLVGQTDGSAVVVQDEKMLLDGIRSGAIRTDAPIEVFSQTTKSPDEYSRICSRLHESVLSKSLLTVHDTVCSQVATRHKALGDFALSHDVIVFVTGRESSNGAVLSGLCKSLNSRTFCVGGAGELDPGWFFPDDRVGVCGATSTPKWLLEEVAVSIENFAI